MKILFILDIISATCQQGICLETSSVERDPVYVCVCIYIYYDWIGKVAFMSAGVCAATIETEQNKTEEEVVDEEVIRRGGGGRRRREGGGGG